MMLKIHPPIAAAVMLGCMETHFYPLQFLDLSLLRPVQAEINNGGLAASWARVFRAAEKFAGPEVEIVRTTAHALELSRWPTEPSGGRTETGCGKCCS